MTRLFDGSDNSGAQERLTPVTRQLRISSRVSFCAALRRARAARNGQSALASSGVLVLRARARSGRTEPDYISVGINHGPLMFSPLGVLGPMDLDPCVLPARRDGVGVVDEQIGTGMTVFVKVRHDTEMDLDVVGNRKPVIATVVRSGREAQPGVMSKCYLKVVHWKDRRDSLHSVHRVTL